MRVMSSWKEIKLKLSESEVQRLEDEMKIPV